MSDYERINANVQTNVNSRRHEAIKRIVAELIKVLLALGVVIGLKAIGFISESFMVILMAIAVVVGAYKVGLISSNIKF